MQRFSSNLVRQSSVDSLIILYPGIFTEGFGRICLHVLDRRQDATITVLPNVSSDAARDESRRVTRVLHTSTSSTANRSNTHESLMGQCHSMRGRFIKLHGSRVR
jgi:hypothetical protein